MKLIIEASHLRAGIDRVRSIVQRVSTVPILSNIRLVAQNGNLTLTASDLAIEMSTTIADVAVELSGEVAVQGHTFGDAIRKLPAGAQVSISAEDEHIHCEAGRIRFDVPTLPAADFPIMQSPQAEFEFTVMASELATALEMSQYCHSKEETRFYLNGTYMVSTETGAAFVATDGHRLASFELEKLELDVGNKIPGMIMPFKAVNEVRRILATAKEIDTVTVRGSSSRFEVEMGNAFIVSKLIDGTYPDYERAIPKQNNVEVRIDAALLKDAIDRVATFASVHKSTVKGGGFSRPIAITLTKDNLNLSAGEAGAVSGQAQEDLTLEYDGPDFSVGCNANYLLDHLAVIKSKEVVLNFTDARQAAMPFTVKPGDNLPHIGVVMPLRINP